MKPLIRKILIEARAATATRSMADSKQCETNVVRLK